MSKFVGFLKRISTPLKAIEYIVSFLVISSAIIAMIESLTDEPLALGTASSFRLLIDQYNIIAYFLILLSAVALIDIIALISQPKNGEKYRAAATFAYTIGFIFLGTLSLYTLGANQLLWVNDLGLAAVCATLYINIKAGSYDERFD